MPVFSRTEWLALLASLHPDTTTDKKRQDAFALLKNHEAALLIGAKPKEPASFAPSPKRPSEAPKTRRRRRRARGRTRQGGESQ